LKNLVILMNLIDWWLSGERKSTNQVFDSLL